MFLSVLLVLVYIVYYSLWFCSTARSLQIFLLLLLLILISFQRPLFDYFISRIFICPQCFIHTSPDYCQCHMYFDYLTHATTTDFTSILDIFFLFLALAYFRFLTESAQKPRDDWKCWFHRAFNVPLPACWNVHVVEKKKTY